MPITIRELIDIPNLRLRLFAGSGGMDREIRWAHASELPDPSEWLEPGALVMTTGLGLPEEPETQRAYVERLARAGLGDYSSASRPTSEYTHLNLPLTWWLRPTNTHFPCC